MQPVTPPASVAEAAAPVKRTWVQRLGTLLFVLVCFEVGAFLLLFPWMDYWDHNSIAALAPWMRGVWDSLRAVMPADPAESAGWLEWLRKPYELADLLQRAPQGALTLPLDDLRLSRWTESDDLDNAPAGAGG